MIETRLAVVRHYEVSVPRNDSLTQILIGTRRKTRDPLDRQFAMIRNIAQLN